MLKWALLLLVIALIAGAIGFGVLGAVVGAAATIARIVFWIFLVLFVLGLLFGRRIFA